ncbi:MAG: hypothetical protein WCW26_03635 [Candidatus Buchananbacteria bacterium]
MTETKNITSEEKIWAAISYLWILSVVAIAARKNNEFVRFHASQGLLLFAVSIVLCFIPVIGWLLNILIGITAIVGIIRALQGEKWQLPVAADLAKSFGDWLVKTLKL